jgi:hypothetical protein
MAGLLMVGDWCEHNTANLPSMKSRGVCCVYLCITLYTFGKIKKIINLLSNDTVCFLEFFSQIFSIFPHYSHSDFSNILLLLGISDRIQCFRPIGPSDNEMKLFVSP